MSASGTLAIFRMKDDESLGRYTNDVVVASVPVVNGTWEECWNAVGEWQATISLADAAVAQVVGEIHASVGAGTIEYFAVIDKGDVTPHEDLALRWPVGMVQALSFDEDAGTVQLSGLMLEQFLNYCVMETPYNTHTIGIGIDESLYTIIDSTVGSLLPEIEKKGLYRAKVPESFPWGKNKFITMPAYGEYSDRPSHGSPSHDMGVAGDFIFKEAQSTNEGLRLLFDTTHAYEGALKANVLNSRDRTSVVLTDRLGTLSGGTYDVDSSDACTHVVAFAKYADQSDRFWAVANPAASAAQRPTRYTCSTISTQQGMSDAQVATAAQSYGALRGYDHRVNRSVDATVVLDRDVRSLVDVGDVVGLEVCGQRLTALVSRMTYVWKNGGMEVRATLGNERLSNIQKALG